LKITELSSRCKIKELQFEKKVASQQRIDEEIKVKANTLDSTQDSHAFNENRYYELKRQLGHTQLEIEVFRKKIRRATQKIIEEKEEKNILTRNKDQYTQTLEDIKSMNEKVRLEVTLVILPGYIFEG